MSDDIQPQEGFQKKFAACTADIAIGGGSAFSGKTFSLLLEPFRGISHPRFNGIFFRRTMPEITAGGGPWDTSTQIYTVNGGRPVESRHRWVWPAGASFRFSHLQLESDVMAHHSAQYVYIAFDELQTFTSRQFWYLQTRCRPPTGYKGRCWVRAGCNPDAGSWLRELLDWWIGPDGYPIPERGGVIRYLTIIDDRVVWVDKDYRDEDGNGPKSFTFIPGTIEDNVIGNEQAPEYKATLASKDRVTRERLLKGNWDISYKGGMFNPDWFKLIEPEELPSGLKRIRYWDFAATEKDEKKKNDPDWTAGVKIAYNKTDVYIEDVVRMQATPGTVEEKMAEVAEVDTKSTLVVWEQEKGSAGRYVSHHIQKDLLKGYDTMPDPVSGDKVKRAEPVAALAEHGHIYIVEGRWNRLFLAEAGSFPLQKKDQIDGLSGACKIAKMQNRVWPRFDRTDPECCRKVKIEYKNFAHYAAVCISNDLVLYVLTAVWYKDARKLFVYGELIGPEMSATKIAAAIVKGMGFKDRQVTGIYGNAEMFAPGRSTAMVLNNEISAICRAGKIPCRALLQKPMMYDMVGSIGLASLMFHNREIVIDESAEEMTRQASSWYIENNAPAKGFHLCEGLCIIIGEINRTYPKPKEKPPIDTYRKRVTKKDKKPKMNSYQIA